MFKILMSIVAPVLVVNVAILILMRYDTKLKEHFYNLLRTILRLAPTAKQMQIAPLKKIIKLHKGKIKSELRKVKNKKGFTSELRLVIDVPNVRLHQVQIITGQVNTYFKKLGYETSSLPEVSAQNRTLYTNIDYKITWYI